MIQTANLRLIPYAPEWILTLIEEPDRFPLVAEYPAAEGLRDFFVSGEVSPDWLANLRTQEQRDAWGLGFAVAHIETQQIIGTAGFKGPPDADGVVEIAYGIVPSFERRGYATEAARALVDYALGTGEVHRVIAHTLPTANASTGVLERCGFEWTHDVVDPEDGPIWRWELVRPPRNPTAS